jgi:hypothetical protein
MDGPKIPTVGQARGDGVVWWRGSSCRFGPEHDIVTERIETADKAPGSAVLVDAIEVIGTEVSEGSGALQHVEGRDQDLVGDGHGRLFGAMRARN